jgi:DNA repair protein RadA/Sms
VDESTEIRISTGPWDPCWGEHTDKDGKHHIGCVNNSVSLIGGKPGAGKSTLSLQFADNILSKVEGEVLYMAEEEAKETVKSRAVRLGLKNTNRIRIIPMGTKVDLGAVILDRKPKAMIYDSLSKICPDPAAAIEFLARLKEYSVLIGSPSIVIDHVTKDEDFAGFMQLQHEVDMTAMFTVFPDEVREIKTRKNRNGPSGVSVLLNMTEVGLTLREPEEDEEAALGNDEEEYDET